MKYLFFLLSTLLVVAANAHGTGLRAGRNRELIRRQDVTAATTSSTTDDDDDETQYLVDLKLCGSPYSNAGADKYYWISLVDSNMNVKGSCLLTIPTGSDIENCCTMSGTTEYASYYGLVVADPKTVTDTSSQQYKTCGENGGSGCPHYSYDSNQQGFAFFQVMTENGSSLWKPGKFVNSGAACGLSDQIGTCDSGAKNVYGDLHVGHSHCLKSSVFLDTICNGHYGFACLHSDC